MTAELYTVHVALPVALAACTKAHNMRGDEVDVRLTEARLRGSRDPLDRSKRWVNPLGYDLMCVGFQRAGQTLKSRLGLPVDDINRLTS